jgi:L-proline---[L-prolyl-carrier protein] ligase
MNDHPIVKRLLDLPPKWRGREIFRSTAGKLTYDELRTGMLRVAGWLSGEQGIRPGDRVAVCLPRGLVAVQAIYGVLASGAAYVPIQFGGPPARIKAMLQSVQPRLLLTTAEMAGRLAADAGPAVPCPIRCVAAEAGPRALEPLLRSVKASSAMADARADDLAVIFFTSGSTAEPKGVMWSHRTMVAAVDWLAHCRQYKAEDRLIGHVGLHYSASMDIFYPLACGCSSFLLTDREAMFPAQVARTIAADRTTVWLSSATMLRLLIESGELEKLDMESLRHVESIGEKPAMAPLRRAMAALPRARFVNCYGATEAFDMAHFIVPRPLPDDMAELPIGRPLGNYQVSLRKADGTEAAAGEIGEICVKGPSVAMGYWGDPGLTAARRIDGEVDSYRTGDLGFLGPDGQFHLVGRQDHLVKLRGHRFDLGEIEAAIKTHPDVRDAAAFAMPTPDGDREIWAVTLVAGGRDLGAELRLACAKRLPVFARPASIMQLQQFPLLSTGKIDREALKAMLSVYNDRGPTSRA